MLQATGVTDEQGKGIEVRAGDIPGFFGPEFWRYYEIYCMTEIMGCLPFTGGWAEQPADMVAAIALFRNERNRMEAEEIERKKTEG